jgi:hypothetical protein
MTSNSRVAVLREHLGQARRCPLILAGTGSSAARIDADFVLIKNRLDPALRKRIEDLSTLLTEQGL